MRLKGITWDHDRGYAPLIETTAAFTALHPDIEIVWSKRSLQAFGDFPVEELARMYDLLIIDHPFTGEACQKNLYLDLRSFLSAAELEDLSHQEIGHSFCCYQYDDKQLALPIDVAALVSACRDDLLEKHHLRRPETLAQVFDFAEKLPAELYMSVPLCATDIWCVFLSLSASFAGGDCVGTHGFDTAAGIEALSCIKRLRTLAHPGALTQNPVQVLNSMATGNEILYAPFLFGYANYSVPGNYPNLVHFYNAPTRNHRPVSVLGGAGIAISAHSAHPREAAEYVKYVTRADIQEHLYFRAGGQPSHRCAWQSPTNNAACQNFFANTYDSITQAYLRPRLPGWNRFQEDASVYVNQQILADAPNDAIIDEVNRLFETHLLTASSVTE